MDDGSHVGRRSDDRLVVITRSLARHGVPIGTGAPVVTVTAVLTKRTGPFGSCSALDVVADWRVRVPEVTAKNEPFPSVA